MTAKGDDIVRVPDFKADIENPDLSGNPIDDW